VIRTAYTFKLTLRLIVSTPSKTVKLTLKKPAAVGVPDSTPPGLKVIPAGNGFVAVQVPVEPPKPLSAVSVYGVYGAPTNASGS